MIGRLFLCVAALAVFAAPGAPSARAQEDSVTLERALALARERSPVVAGARAEVRGAEARISGARALRAPRLSADGLYLRFHDPPSLALSPAATFAPLTQDGYLIQLGALQPVYTGGRIGAAVRAAEWGGRAAAAAREGAEVDVTAEVAAAHNAALLAEALLGVAEDAVRVLRSAVAVAVEQYEAGTVARLDVLRAETRLGAAEEEARAAVEGVSASRERLAVLIGVEPALAPRASGSLEPARVLLDSTAVAGLLARSRESRPDLRALAAAAKAAAAEEQGARAALRPTASVYAAALATRPELLTGRETWTTDFVGGLVVSWPVFDFGRAAGDAQAARAEADRLEAEARRRAAAAEARARVALRTLTRATLDIGAGRENVKRAERALEIAQDRYREGVGIQLEVLEAEADLSRARAAWLRAIHDHRSAAVELNRAVGLPADAALPTRREER